ncbi:phage tail tape measure protein [Salinisphaera sp. USBA-960]|nr:phage tail tape measure protein [Salifodinibacter halophilus]NNC25292.1 phage tail tape measure protein [Salifodinibacter halophilus]
MAQDLNLSVTLRAIDKVTRPLKKIDRSGSKTAEALKASRKQLGQLNAAQKRLKGFEKLKSTSRETGRALNAEQEKIKALTRQIKQADGPTKRLTQSRDKAIRQARKLKQRYAGEQGELEQMRRTIKKTDGITGNYARAQRRLGSKVESTNRQIKTQEQRLARVAKRQKAAARAAERYRRGADLGGRMRGGGFGAAAGGAAALYGAGRMLAPGVSYGEQTSELQAVTGLDQGNKKLDALKKQARHLGSTTQFSATETAAGQTFLARAGFTPDAIRASMQDVLDEALVGGLDLSSAADITSNIAGVFQIDPEQAGNMSRVVDTLTAASTHANVNIKMLGDTMKYLGQAKGLDVTLEQSAALAGVLGNMGVQGSQAGTTLRQMMQRLSAPTAKARKAIQGLGLDLTDAQGDLKSVPNILQQVAQATNDMGNAERAANLSAIFGTRAGAGVASLIDKLGSEGLQGLLHSVQNAQGETAKKASVMADNIGGDLKSLQSAWDEVGISVTDANKGPLRGLIGTITTITRGVGSWIKANPELASKLTTAAGAVAALVAVGGMLTVMLGSIIAPIYLIGAALPAVTAAFAAFNAVLLANPITWIIGAVIALGVAVYALYKHWDSVSAWFSQRWQDIKDAFSHGIAGVTKLILNWSPVGLIYRGLTKALQLLGVDIPKKYRTLGGLIVDGLGGAIMDGIRSLPTQLNQAWARIKQAFSEGLGGVAKLALNWSPFGLIYKGLVAAAESLGLKVPKRFQSLGSAIIDGLGGAIKTALAALLNELPKKFMQLGSAIAHGIVTGLKNAGGAVKDAVVGLGSSTVGWFKNKLGIQSPSRVFMGLGQNTVEGYRLGLAREQTRAVGQMGTLVRALTSAGAGLGVAAGGASMPASAGQNIGIDNRPPVAARSAPAATGPLIGSITINAAPGMDERALSEHVATEVQRALADAGYDQAASRRSALYDTE